MTLTVDVDEVASRLDELLAEVAAGGEVILARGTETLAKMTRAETPAPKSDAARAIAEIRAGRQGRPRTTIEEILKWKDEDRR